MNKHSNFKILLFLLPVFLSLSFSTVGTKKNEMTFVQCKNDLTGSKTSSPGIMQGTFEGALDILYIRRAFFDDLLMGESLLFCHSFGASGRIYLSGWLYRDGDFDDSPNILLSNAGPSAVRYDDNTYFGNVILKPSAFNKIKRALKNEGMEFVIFKPVLVKSHYVGYEISVSPNPGLALEPKILAVIEANPSPPKTY